MGRGFLYIFCLICFLSAGEEPGSGISGLCLQFRVTQHAVPAVNTVETDNTISRPEAQFPLVSQYQVPITNLPSPAQQTRSHVISTCNGPKTQIFQEYIYITGNKGQCCQPYLYGSAIYYLKKLLI